MKTLYETLGVPKNASEKEIRKAYLELARKHHPDKNSGVGGTRMGEINEAHRVLSDKEMRKFYDEYGDWWEQKYNEAHGLGLSVCNKCGNRFEGEGIENGIPGKIFCSQRCSYDYLRKIREDQFCRVCGNRHRGDVPKKCTIALSYISNLENLSHWTFFSSKEKDCFWQRKLVINKSLSELVIFFLLLIGFLTFF